MVRAAAAGQRPDLLATVSDGCRVCVAPNRAAMASRSSCRSIAMIARAGDPRALDRAQPDTAAAHHGHGVADPDARGVDRRAEPGQHPQPISAAEASGIVSGIFTAAPSGTTQRSVKVPSPAIWYTGWPPWR